MPQKSPIAARILRATIALVLGATFGVIIVLSSQLRTELRALQEVPVDNLQWNVTQLELDVVRLEVAVTTAMLQPEAGLTEVRKRFDLLYNRAGTINSGTMLEQLGLSEAALPLKRRLKEFLIETTGLIDSEDYILRGVLPQIATTVGKLRQEMRAMSVQVIDANAAIQDARRASLANILRKIAVASFALITLLLALLALVLWLNRQARKRAEEVRRIAARLSATVVTSLDAVVVAGMNGRIIEFNASAERIFGFDRAEAIGKLLSELIVPPQHRHAHEAGMVRMRSTGVKHVVDAGRIQITACRKSGEEFPIELSITSSDGPDGMIFIAYLRDISAAQRAEAALVAARDEAQTAERAKTSFIAVMSHEMRTPLNGVIAALEIIGRTTLDAKQARFLGLARSSSQQLLRHVNDVLDISRIDSGFVAVAGDRFDLPALIATLVDPLRPAAAQNNTRIDVQLLSEFPPVQGDPFRLGQILQNFISNAIKFTHDGTITIEAEVQAISGNRATIEFRVIDTGIGIAEADQARIFEEFVMVDPSYGRSVGGTGLGLAISRRLARAMDGEVGVESALGEGSCFWLNLPLTIALEQLSEVRPVDQPAFAGDGPTAAQLPGVRHPMPQAAASGRALKVLVVEDNETNRIVMEEMLRHLGHHVTLAVDGVEGVKLARLQKFDVILMDLSMPQMDGWSAAAAIRQDGASQGSKIIAVTAHARPERMERFAESGMDNWLTKPISTRALSAALEVDPVKQVQTERTPKPDDAMIPLLDTERLTELSSIADAAAMQKLMDRFHTQMDKTLDAIKVGAGDVPLATLAALCHEGAGAAAVTGAKRLHGHLARMEAACRANDRAAVLSDQAKLNELWQATWTAMTQRH